MDQDRQLPPRASNRSCVARRRADLPEKGLRSSQHVPARTTDVSASSPHEATQPITQAFLQSTLPASTIFESWLPMDSEIVRKGNCNANLDRLRVDSRSLSLYQGRPRKSYRHPLTNIETSLSEDGSPPTGPRTGRRRA